MKTFLKLLVSIGLSSIILAFLLQAVFSGVPDQDRPSILAALQNTNLTLVFVYLLIYLLTLVVRAQRYQWLIALSGEKSVPTMQQMMIVTGVRNMIVDMLPARLGELGYVGMLNRGYGVKLENCISSLGLSIALDLIALFVVVLLVVIKQFAGPGVETWALAAVVSAAVLSSVALFGLFFIMPKISTWLGARSLGSDSGKLGKWPSKAIFFISEFSASLQTVRQSGKAMGLIAVSVVIRILKYTGFYLLFLAVAKPMFAELADLPVESVVSALIGGELSASLPVPSFMGFGVYEAGSTLVFNIIGIADQAKALVTMLCVHIWSQLVEYILGGAFLALFVLFSRSGKAPGEQVSKFRALTAKVVSAVLLIGGLSFLAVELYAAKKIGALSAPVVGEVASDVGEWQALSKQFLSSIDGFAVFSSNRDGNHDIFKLNFKDYSLVKVTDHANTETYPRISPDGQRLVFSRSQQPWVSQRNSVAWDVYLLDLKTGTEKIIDSNATAPHWVSDSEITYLKNATTVIKTNVDDLQQEIIYQTGVDNRMPEGSFIQNPKYNPVTKQLVFTGRQTHIGINSGHWGTAITLGNDHRGLYNGCELGWTSDGDMLYQVTTGGRDNGKVDGGLRIISVDPKSFESKTLIDLDGEFSHEYWPKDSSNGEYVIFGASRGSHDHEHDTKDYEIFLWKTGSDSSKATRLTFHTGNENWPDVYIAN